MSFDDDSFPTTPEPLRFSAIWDVCVPVSIAAVPSIAFTLLRLVTKGLDKPGDVDIPAWVMIAMIVLQLVGMLSMAIVILVRSDFRMKQLSAFTNDNPAVWRKRLLTASMFFLLLFDVIFNVAAGIRGAGPLVILAIPMFIAYVICIRVAFAKLGEM